MKTSLLIPPYIAFGINDQHQVTFTHVLKPDEKDPFSFEIGLPELNADGLDKAKERIGGMTLGALAHFHPRVWEQYPNLKPPFEGQTDVDLIHELCAKSRALKTRTFIPAIQLIIDDLVAKHPDAANLPTINTWPDYRAGLERYPS